LGKCFWENLIQGILVREKLIVLQKGASIKNTLMFHDLVAKVAPTAVGAS